MSSSLQPEAGEHQVLMVAPEPGRVVSGLVN